ncbi:MAG TPA: alpha/beta fold hydrolase [Alphaproteobacteria bacterium]|nr:alpha/beta fold hydrolase [Alphaproteobacteria bacterium]
MAIEPERDRGWYGTEILAEVVDRSLHALLARATVGLSPASLFAAYLDWATHLGFSPGKRLQLGIKAARKGARYVAYAAGLALDPAADSIPCIDPLPQDNRFRSDAWKRWPFNLVYQGFLLNQQLWHNATTGVRGVTRHHERMVEFGARQILDMFSPSNCPLLNPEILERTLSSCGMNFVLGARNFVEDWERLAGGRKPVGADAFRVGANIAVTPGKVVYRNRLIELIQYAPASEVVRPEPILIVPAWIMKYYILDLSPGNSLVKYLVDNGFTVFMISWKNPGPDDRDLSMEDYRLLGVMAAVDTVGAIVPDRKIHSVGYCIGGTLLAISAAAMARDGDERFSSMTLFAAQTDFTEAGELMLFIDESQLSFLEDMMWEHGYLDSAQMAGAFQLLRSNDLIWSRMARDYLMGERAPMIDLMAWNTDATRMPFRMHSEYLRRLFLNNELAEGRFVAGGRPVALSDVRLPIFAVGTVKDHVAPWRSSYKIGLLTEAELTFVLTTGGHNAGIVSEPGHQGRSFQIMTRPAGGHYVDPEAWARAAPRKDGSWWPEWIGWLSSRSGAPQSPPEMGAPAAGLPLLGDAPGEYVRRN